jgi:hypothetical protein
MRIKKLLILGAAPILLSSYMCIASISVKEPLEIQSAVVKNEKISEKHADKMKKICKSKTNASIKTIKKINSDKILVSSASSSKTLNNEKIVKKQFENKKREILNTMNELKYKKRDIANKMNELTSEIESLQDFALTGEEKNAIFILVLVVEKHTLVTLMQL